MSSLCFAHLPARRKLLERPHVGPSILPRVSQRDLTKVAIGVVVAGAQAFPSTMPFEKKKDPKKQRASRAGTQARYGGAPKPGRRRPSFSRLRLDLTRGVFCACCWQASQRNGVSRTRCGSLGSREWISRRRARMGAGQLRRTDPLPICSRYDRLSSRACLPLLNRRADTRHSVVHSAIAYRAVASHSIIQCVRPECHE